MTYIHVYIQTDQHVSNTIQPVVHDISMFIFSPMINCAMVICFAPLDSLNFKILVRNTGNNDLECDAHNFYKQTEMKLVVVVTPDKLLLFYLI